MVGMLYNETTVYILAAILVFIVGLIFFCCCRIWYDLLGCSKEARRRNKRNNHNEAILEDGQVIITDNEESRFKAEPNGVSNREFPAMKIIVTDSEGATTSGQVSRQAAPSVTTPNICISGPDET